MFFKEYKSILYSDTLVPDIFITEYMPSMDGDYVKIYLHFLFLSKYNKWATDEEIAKKLEIDIDKVKKALFYFESVGIITNTENGVELADLKEKEINKMYRLKLTSTPEEAALSAERNKKRNKIISSINNRFFQGVMPPSWYTDIDAWFDKYQFDEDVMFELFQLCYENNGLSKNYIISVAEDWHRRNIKDHFELEKYLNEVKKYKDIRGMIVKKLNLNRNLTQYEEEYVKKWVMDYGYGFDIIELALRKTTGKTNPNINYIHKIITDWNKKNLRTKEEVEADIAKFASVNTSAADKKGRKAAVPQKGNFDQREYDDQFFDSLYDNTAKSKFDADK